MAKISREKLAAAAWYWAEQKLLDTAWDTRVSDYDAWYEFYRGRQWEQESVDLLKHITYRPVYNEVRTAIEEHVAHLLKAAPRHYHVNTDVNIIEQLAFNAFMVRATRANMYVFRRNALQLGMIYGAAILSFDIDLYAQPPGYIPLVETGDTQQTLPMPRYRAYAPWQWVIDPTSDGERLQPLYAIRFFTIPVNQAKQIVGKDVGNSGGGYCSRVWTRFLQRQTSQRNVNTQSTVLTRTDNERIMGMDIWFRDVGIGDPSNPVVPPKSQLRFLRIIGNKASYFGEAPLGERVGIPIAIYTPFPEANYMFGQSFVRRAWDIQRDINFRRAKAREAELYFRDIFAVRGNQAETAAARIRQQLGTGVIAVPKQAIVEHIRGTRVDSSLYNEIDRSLAHFQRILGVPPVLMGFNETGSYSAQQTTALQNAAGVVMAWKESEFAKALIELGEKEWEALKYLWDGRRIVMDTGSQSIIFTTEIMNIPGWSVEVVPEQTYMQIMQMADQSVQQLFLQGLVDPMTFYKHIPFLSEDEKNRSLQNLMAMQQAAAAAASSGQSSGRTPGK